jgi:hypothetical protein
MVCLRNISVDTGHNGNIKKKNDDDDDDDDDDDNDNNNNNTCVLSTYNITTHYVYNKQNNA